LRLSVLLRLAAVLHRDRGTRPLPHVGLAVSPDNPEQVTLTLPSTWLRRHPLTRLNLQQEAAYLNGIPIQLTISAR
jgi:exopolyphosphatase/guanosine-5'-triphosphate,3'-diphosphate pyrophosphatase